jgi:hypothetical protein
MVKINVIVTGTIMNFQADWTVGEAETTIRKKYCLQGGGLQNEEGCALLETALLTDTIEEISFVGGQLIQQGLKGLFDLFTFSLLSPLCIILFSFAPYCLPHM